MLDIDFQKNKTLKFAVIGCGRSGKAALRLLHERGYSVILLEKNSKAINEEFNEWLSQNNIPVFCGEHKPEFFKDVDIVIPSPAAAKSQILPILPTKIDGTKAEIMAETEMAWRMLNGEPVIAITGTSGKTTTVSLCSAMLESHGFHVFTGGNIGTPLSEYIISRDQGGTKADVIVLELSSFQLQTCSFFHPQVAVLINLSANHLDFHKDMDEYTEAKMKIFSCQTENDLALLPFSLKDFEHKFDLKARIKLIPEHASSFPNTKLLGEHNQINAETAFMAASEFGVSREEAKKAVAEFTPIPHRLEYIDCIDEVTYINDSKCTTLEALAVALRAFHSPIILLTGGKFKGGDPNIIKELLQEHVKHAILYGASRKIFADAWSSYLPLSSYETMDEALFHAKSISTEGDIILLSPATSSFDQYKNYKERGNHFIELVKEIKK